jgi:DNA-binding CsgD family transcriptional regulator
VDEKLKISEKVVWNHVARRKYDVLDSSIIVG